ncbi:acyl-CoA dehydrogenase family protein [Burkholderia gladioli]|uniref:acyl-CoA dehydrogenase family protein n=1 Tax=Burkholderia gladioli TaxID=28095 RepID=UPI0020B39228|nr:acyl-CoA dehydrogenase family protein [Burkholderia gladioli]
MTPSPQTQPRSDPPRQPAPRRPAVARASEQAAPRDRVPDLAELDALLAGMPAPLDDAALASAAHRLAAAWPSLPRPGAGDTLARWRFLAGVAAHDLPLVKLYEAHADAEAILAELDALPARNEPEPEPELGLLAVWAARMPGQELRVTHREGEGAAVRLTGTKAWCSGAACVDTALLTCLDDAGHDRLAAVPMRQPGVTVSTRGWEALGMRATQSVEVDFADASARLVGPPGGYLRRPGFWHGGAGIAACWYGAAAALAARLREAAARREDPHLQAHLGAADVALSAARALLREAAQTIDANPRADAMTLALRTRGAVEQAAEAVLRAALRGLGAGPLCRDRWFARMAADLPVFMRQSHAERDLAALGAALAQAREDWRL